MRREFGGVFGFGFLALGELGRRFRERHAADGAPDAEAHHLAGRGRTAQHTGHAVVVLEAYRVELVVMAAGATHRHAEESPADLDELGIDVIGLHLGLVGIHDLEVADHQEARGDELGGTLLRRGGRHQVAGKLLLDEEVERLVLIEGLDEVIAIAPGVFGEDFVGSPDHVGVAREVEPVAGPAFAVGRRSQQTVDDLGVSGVRIIIRESDDFLRGGRKAGKIEADAADPGMSVGVAGGLESLGFDFREQETVDGVFRPEGVFDGGSGRVGDRLEGPELSAGFEVDRALRLGGLRGIVRARIGGAALYPLLEDGDFIRRQAAFGRHREILVEVAHRLDDEALCEIARDDRRSVVAAVLPARTRVERKASFGLLFRRMTVVAPLDQHRPHLRLEEQVVVASGQQGERREEKGGDGAEAGHFA